MIEALQLEFMQNAVGAGLLVCIACGVIGTLVVVNRIVFISGGIAHAAYGGIGMAVFFKIPYMLGTLIFSLIISALMAMVSLKSKHRADTVVGVMWAAGMAMGVIFLDLTPGYRVDLMSYLFGSILTVPRSDLWLMLALDIFIVITVGWFYNDFLAMSYDEEFAKVRGVSVKVLYFLLMGMIALSVVMTIRVVGLILVIALLTIPPYIAEQYSRSLSGMMILSVIFGMGFTLTGLWLSYLFNLTSGATIIMVGGAGFFISVIIERFYK